MQAERVRVVSNAPAVVGDRRVLIHKRNGQSHFNALHGLDFEITSINYNDSCNRGYGLIKCSTTAISNAS